MESKTLTFLGPDTVHPTAGNSIFKNHNSELVNELLNFKPEPKFKSFNGEEWTVTDEIDQDGEQKCVSGKNVHWFKVGEIEKNIGLIRENSLNTLYDPIKEFFKQHGPLYKFNHTTMEDFKGLNWYTHYDGLELVVLSGGGSGGGSAFQTYIDQHQFIYIDQYRKNENYDQGGEISLSYKKWGNITFMRWNSEGNFTNRDYNVKLQDYNQTPYDTFEMIKAMKKRVLELGDMECSTKAGHYYFPIEHPNFCIEMYAHEERSNMQAGLRLIQSKHKVAGAWQSDSSGAKIIRKPIKTIIKTAEELWFDFETLRLPLLVDKFVSSEKLFTR